MSPTVTIGKRLVGNVVADREHAPRRLCRHHMDVTVLCVRRPKAHVPPPLGLDGRERALRELRCRAHPRTAVFEARSRSIRHAAQTSPSCSTEPLPTPPTRASATRRSRGTTRVRSACESRTLSYSGRNRVGAGTSASGCGASGDVEQLAPAFVAERPEPRPQSLDDLAHAGQPAPRRHVGNGSGPECGEVSEDDALDRRPLLDAGARATTARSRASPARPSPRGRAEASGRREAGSGTRMRALRSRAQ